MSNERRNEKYDGNKKFKFLFTRDYSLLFVIPKSFVTKVLSDFFSLPFEAFMDNERNERKQRVSLLVRCNNNPSVKWTATADEQWELLWLHCRCTVD
jgi:hypothetical protein